MKVLRTPDSAFAKLIFWPTILNCVKTTEGTKQVWLRGIENTDQGLRIFNVTPHKVDETIDDFAFFALCMRFRGTFTQSFAMVSRVPPGGL